MNQSSNQSMSGHVAMLTGAARGIGAATARAFAERGVDVVICDVLDDDGHAVVEELVGLGVKADYVHTDVADAAAVQAAVAHTVNTFGRLDHAFNNAGIFAAAPLAELDVDEWRRVIDVNLSGVFHCLKYQLQHMLAAGSGSIVNTASVWSFAPAAGQTAYVAAKHGIVGLTKNAALDHGASGVRVNAVAPGPIATPMTSVVPDDVMSRIVARTAENRFGRPEEIAHAAVWLCSPEASFVNGSVLPVDGGWLNG